MGEHQSRPTDDAIIALCDAAIEAKANFDVPDASYLKAIKAYEAALSPEVVKALVVEKGAQEVEIVRLREGASRALAQIGNTRFGQAEATLRAALSAIPAEASEEVAITEACEPGKVYVTVSGLTGTGKSAVMGEIEIAMRALGLEVEGDARTDLRMYGDYQSGIDLYKPKIVLAERNIPTPPRALKGDG